MSKVSKQRGYSLVELALSLAVVGIIMGGVAVPIGNQLREQVYKKASLQMGEIVDAIVGYAVTNRTNGFMVAHSNFANNDDLNLFGHRLTRIAAGRPYLPCPDRDGDGFEDRVRTPYRPSSLDRISPYPDNLTVRQIDVLTTTEIAGSDPSDFPMSGPTSGNRQLPFGECEAHSGFLPYNTLGLKPGDPWGSSHTYIVNSNFATAAIGFDQLTRGSLYSPLYATYYDTLTYPLRAVAGPVVSGTGTSRRINMERPLLVCHYHSSVVCFQNSSYLFARGFDTGTGNAFSYNASGGHVLGSYFRRDLDFYIPDYQSFFDVQAVTDGVPFAVISHGLNRLGSASARRAGNAVQCTQSPNTSTAEYFNASFNGCNGLAPSTAYSSKIGRFSPDAGNDIFVHVNIFASERAATTANETFVGINTSKQIYSSYTQDFDDIVTWLTRRELMARMRRAGVFPIPKKDIFRGFTPYFAYYR